ncbi:hypothetical protein HY628_01520 [Candidatus Uhrbacteria bacterium]|nr:hypothetical protein [Candidatus Uhrbacteria bacterium]
MFGLILTLVYAAYCVITGMSLEQFYLPATNFLFWWYLIWSIPLALIILFVVVILPLIGAVAVGDRLGKMGRLLGFVAGGSLSLLTVFLFAVRSGLAIGGAYLLNQGLTVIGGQPHWNQTSAALGGIMVLIHVIARSSSSSSNGEQTRRYELPERRSHYPKRRYPY